MGERPRTSGTALALPTCGSGEGDGAEMERVATVVWRGSVIGIVAAACLALLHPAAAEPTRGAEPRPVCHEVRGIVDRVIIETQRPVRLETVRVHMTVRSVGGAEVDLALGELPRVAALYPQLHVGSHVAVGCTPPYVRVFPTPGDTGDRVLLARRRHPSGGSAQILSPEGLGPWSTERWDTTSVSPDWMRRSCVWRMNARTCTSPQS